MIYSKRLNQLQQMITEPLLIEDETSLFYLTGKHFSAGKLIVTPTQKALILDGRYFEGARNQNVYPVRLLNDSSFKDIIKEFAIQTLSFSDDDTTYKRYEELTKYEVTLLPIENPVRKLRLIKDEQEIELLREAAHLGSRGYDLVASLLEEGITEQDLAQELHLFWIRQGGTAFAFEPIIAFGKATSQPHYRAGPQRLAKGQPVLIDIGVTLNDYHSDMTRTVFFGEPQKKILEIYKIVLRAQEAALAQCRQGVTVGQLDSAARDVIITAGYGEEFSHSLGHGIGLDVHEAPALRNKGVHKDVLLQQGMVITIEPGIYLADLGGVRIEDTVVITDLGYEDLTQRPKDIRIL